VKRRWLTRLAILLLAPLVFLLVLEASLAVAGVRVPRYAGYRDHGSYWVPCEEPGKPPGWDRDPSFARNYKHVPEVPPLFLRDKPANGWRVFVLGESSVKGLPYEVGCFADWLRLRAAAMLPDRTVEVVNAGMAGWHATDIRLLLQDCLEHEPDLLIWMVGHNEFVPDNVLTLRDEIEHPVFHRLYAGVARLRTATWLGGWLPALHPYREPVFDHLQSSEQPLYGAELPLIKQRFRETTAAAVADARAAGVPIILCTMARNVRESPPAYSHFSEATRADAAQRARWDEAYDAGLAAFDCGDAAAAIPELQRALAIDATPAKAHFALARALEKAGRADEARATYEQALERDAGPMRAQAWAEQAIRDVAQQTGAPLADLQAAFDQRSKLGLAGGELVVDNCHPNLAGHEVIASILLAVIERNLKLPFDHDRDVSSREGRKALGLDDYGAQTAKESEAVNLGKLALQSGVVDETWRQAHDLCRDALAGDPAA